MCFRLKWQKSWLRLNLQTKSWASQPSVITPPNLPPSKVGRFGNVGKEAMLKLEPTVVFAAGLEQEAIAEELKKLNIKVVTVYPQSLDELYDAITYIGAITGTQQRAKLSFPYNKCKRICCTVSVFKSKNSRFRQKTVQWFNKSFFRSP